MPVFITPFWTLHNEQRKTKLYFFKKHDSILKPTCLGLNETGMPHQLSCRHFFWQLQDTLFTPVVECSTEGHLSFFLSFFLSQFFFFFFLWNRKPQQKIFLLFQKWFIWERHQDVISIPVKGSRASGSYEICLKKPTMEKRWLFQFKRKKNPASLSMSCQTQLQILRKYFR